MTRRIRWVAILSLFSLCALAGRSSPAEAVAEESSTSHEAGAQDDQRLWIEPGPAASGRKAVIRVRYEKDQPACEPVVFDCEVHSEVPVENASLRIQILDDDGVELYQGELPLSVDTGAKPCKFQWDAAEAPPGSYCVHLDLLRRPAFEIAHRELRVRKVSLSQLSIDLEEAESRINGLRKRLEALAAEGVKPPYAWMRLAIAKDFVDIARKWLAKEQWRRADTVIHYLRRTADSVQAHLVFGAVAPELSEPIPSPDLGQLEIRDGAFYAEGRPVFLLGACGWDQLARDISVLRSYGLNLAAFSIGPNETLAGPGQEADFRAELDPIFRRARKHNVSVAFSLSPAAMPEWAIEKYPEMAVDDQGSIDITQPGASKTLKQHIEAVVPYLAKQEMLNSLCLVKKPAFRFTGPRVRDDFLARIKEFYGDRHDLNRSWKAIFADFEDLDIGWVEANARYQQSPAYQYDWQTFHRELGAKFVLDFRGVVRRAAPSTPLQVAFADDVFEHGESKMGIDREALVHQLDLSGCCAGNLCTDQFFAMGYPQQALVYTLMKSLAPGKPVFNIEDRIIAENDLENVYDFAYVHSALWDAAISGLNASAVWVWDRSEAVPELKHNILMRPECLEAYATACLDLNRLAPIVVAFQQAVAPVAILWSAPSKIFGNGVPYLVSARDSFEGCSFSGYKVRFITEKQCVDSKLADVKVLVLPDTPAVGEDAFEVLKDYIQGGGVTVRTQSPVHYDEYGHSRRDIIGNTSRTVLVRGLNLPTEYLHAMDAVTGLDELEPIPRMTNKYGYPLEGVKSQYVEVDGQGYLYVLNIRKQPVLAYLYGSIRSGRDLIHGADAVFPAKLEPLSPMLIRLNMAEAQTTIGPVTRIAESNRGD